MPDNIQFSISPADTPKDTKGTPACDLRIDPQEALYTSTLNKRINEPANVHYTKKKPAENHHTAEKCVSTSSLRDMLRDAEKEYERNQKHRKSKLYWRLFRTNLLILSLLMFFYFVGTLSPETLLDYVIIAADCAAFGAIFSFILAAIARPLHMSAHNVCFDGEFEDRYRIEHIKDSMCK